MALTAEYVDEMILSFEKHFPNLSKQTPDSAPIQILYEQINKFDDRLGYPPPFETVSRIAAPLEAQLQEQADAAEHEAREQAARDARFDRDFRQSSEIDKQEALEEIRARQPQQQPTREVPEFSQEEIDSMSDAEAREKLFGLKDRGFNQSGPAPESIRVRKGTSAIIAKAYDGRRAVEASDRAARQRQVEMDAAQKKALRAELKAALNQGAK